MDNATINLDYFTVFASGATMDDHKQGNANPQGDIGITVRSVGVRWYHPGGFVIDRPDGLNEYSFIQWLTPTIFKINGKTTTEPPGGCIFYGPGQTTWYGADAFTPFGNNWLHFSGPLVGQVLADGGVPLAKPVYLRNDAFIEESLRLFLKESMSSSPGRHLAISAHALLFLIEFGRRLRESAASSKSARNMEHREKFEDFRELLRERCVEQWTLGKMAAELHLSPSRFSNLYREFFDAKPVDDLIRMRLELAGYYLKTTNMPVSYVANLCGFTDVYYFSRAFKAKMGQTPTAYRSDN